MQIFDKLIGELTPYEKNPRKNQAAVAKVAASIREFGFKVPMVITPAGEVVAGHTRLLAAKEIGLTTVPCVIADDLTPEQIKAFRLADNKTAEFAEWDMDLLMEELQDIGDIDMELFGFDTSVFAEEAEITEDDFEPAPKKEPRTRRGDIYTLGNHRLMCGDSSSGEDLDELMGGGRRPRLYRSALWCFNRRQEQDAE